jgi:hypothetical protein
MSGVFIRSAAASLSRQLGAKVKKKNNGVAARQGKGGHSHGS